jgi:dihydroorotate dehydrogenase
VTIYDAIRPLLFRLDAERAHHLAVGATGILERGLQLARLDPAACSDPRLHQRICGIEFPNPVGLAAGFDKDARAPHVWPLFGFGFAELGTITRHGQPGNPRPRMFRVVADRGLINRLGFNNQGADAVATRLARSLRRTRPAIPLGINLGKSKITELADAPADYLYSLGRLFAFADYITINVSSPNTPGLRDLQAEDELARLVRLTKEASLRLAIEQDCAPRPLFVKVAPDLDDDALARIVDVVHENEATGLIATNTTIRRTGLTTSIDEAGGLSGAPLRGRSTDVVRLLRRRAGRAMPIIGVGGIFTAADAYEKIRAGADLVQIYSAMVYQGPFLARRIARGLSELLARDGYDNVAGAVGADA